MTVLTSHLWLFIILHSASGSFNLSNPAIDFDEEEITDQWLPSWFSWNPTSPRQVRQAERKILEYVDTQSLGFYVKIQLPDGQECKIWTRRFGSDIQGKVPLVLVHGMAAGLAMFALNFDDLASERMVYALDLPGFARSSRTVFSENPDDIEQSYVNIIEGWREALGLERIDLLGHSYGGYLVGHYGLRYPEHLNVLILADPWGMTEKPKDWKPRRKLPAWAKTLAGVLMNFNPLWGLRASGPAGPWLVKKIRPDIMRKFEDLFGPGNTTLMAEYLFHCNAQEPTGESAFHSLMSGFGWPKQPLLPRLNGLSETVSVKVYYGSSTWMTHLQNEDFTREGVKASIDVEYIDGAGHHIYADQYKDFNIALNNCLSQYD